MPVAAHGLTERLTPDRRDNRQPSERLIGRVTSCDGSRATIATSATHIEEGSADFWSIGRLISINIGSARIVGLVYAMRTPDGEWDEDRVNPILVDVELVGEIVDRPGTGVEFNRGISTYPYLGAVAHRIRGADLHAVHDLGRRGGVAVGTLSQDDEILATVCIEDMLKRHFAVVGTTGVGKSSAVSILLRNAVATRPNLRVLILDPHNEYARAFPNESIQLDAASLELPFWMFRYDELADVLFRGRTGLEDEQDILRELIPLARSRFQAGQMGAQQGSLLKRPLDGGKFTADSPFPYRMSDLLSLLEDMMGKLDPKHQRHHMRSLKGRIESLVYDPRFAFMFGRTAIEDNLDKVIGQIFRVPHHGKRMTVLQLGGLPSEVLNAVASIMSRMAFDLAVHSEGQYEILLVCEEAHRYVPEDQAQGFVPTRLSIAKIAKEGRKYGAYLGIITQRPGELDPTILSQCSTVFAMRLANDRDQEIIRSAIADSSASTITFLSSIGNREAIAFGEGVATTMRMRFAHQERHLLPQALGDAMEDLPRAPVDLNIGSIISRMRMVGAGEGR
ncbi:MAG: ATP-binding protein [Bosea sp. (in: a-proteobacteria)]